MTKQEKRKKKERKKRGKKKRKKETIELTSVTLYCVPDSSTTAKRSSGLAGVSGRGLPLIEKGCLTKE